ncbi:DNA translocase FtsK [Candidatus Roizmanbacteria bacterium]|nr:DNA translocase FtsK [Candidatus Roizmanbacteria bacterium]
MGRRKSKVRLPIFKFKVNAKTALNIVGFGLIIAGTISLLSFFNIFSSDGFNGRVLQQTNKILVIKFGGFAIFVPFVLFLLSGHFFNVKKVKFVKPHLSVGMLLVFSSLFIIFQSGDWGRNIWQTMSSDFSVLGTSIILLIALIVGLILTFDTSVDVVAVAFLKFIQISAKFLMGHMYRPGEKNIVKGEVDKKGVKDETFIKDKKVEVNAQRPPVVNQQHPAPHPAAASSDFTVRPLAPNSSSTWVYPPLNLLADVAQKEADRGDTAQNAHVIEKTLDSFGIRAHVAEVNFGPTVTQYALEIAMGTKLSKITALGNDLALALAAPTGQVRIEAPIPGRSLVGIEIPNIKPEIVTLKRLMSTSVFSSNPDPLLVPLGLDVAGQVQGSSVGKMPHTLIAGTTGSGKSVMLNAWITTFLMRTKPEELRMILVDPKRVELALYNGIPHLLTEVIVEPDKILKALSWTVSEMENRYKEFATVGVRNLEGFNALEGVEKKPYIVFVIDELADLMMFASSEAEDFITRIAQMARATGIHLVLATQRPSVDVITGLMKANIPTRLAFNVSSMVDSRVIIDMPGAEKLLGKGDMLFLPPDQAKPRRIQGPYITDKEVAEVVKFLKAQVPVVHYTEEITEKTLPVGGKGSFAGVGGGGSDVDPLFEQIVEFIGSTDKVSASLLQRKFKLGFSRAARILDELEAAGYIGPADGSKPREVLRRGAVVEGTEPVEGQEQY